MFAGPARHVETVHWRHGQIDDQNVRPQQLSLGNACFPIRDFPDDFVTILLFNQRPNAGAEDRVIVRQ